MSEDLFTQIELNISFIQGAKKEIADLKQEKIQKRSDAWAEATGSAKEREDFVKATVSEIDKEIAYKEANVEYLYNMNKLLNDRLVFAKDG